MFIPASELKRSAELASDISECALKLLDVAESVQNETHSASLIEIARKLVTVSEELNRSVENTAVANSASAPGLFGLAGFMRSDDERRRWLIADALMNGR